MKQKISIAGRPIGCGEKTFIIAEIGSNHNQNIKQAKKMIDIVSACKVDAVKFQLFKAEVLCSPSDVAFKIVKENEFPRDWLKELMGYADKKGVIFMATPFDYEAVDLLHKAGVKAFKVASSEVVNFALLRQIALTQKPIILSVGMSNIAEVYEALEVIEQSGNEQVVLLQCSALYPTPPAQVHLRVMDTLKNAFGVPVGFSDHTLGILFPSAAVARGACVIEKHFTLDRKMPGPDHSYAIEPDELSQMVKDIRAVEQSLGSSLKRLLPEEKDQVRRVSIFAKRNIAKNATITNEDIVVKRPASGVDPRYLDLIVGAKSLKHVKAGEAVVWSNLGEKVK